MKVSLVIPCYNEQKYIASCLESAMQQVVPFDEIIIVNNNCTDRTMEIVSQFPSVRVISEKVQGMTPARNAGFRAATGDVIARTDADAILPSDWNLQIHKIFADDTVDALSGPGVVYDLFSFYKGNTSTRAYATVMKFIFNGHETLVGFNMVLRKRMWDQVKPTVCLDDSKVHEDMDLALHIHAKGGHIEYRNDFFVFASARRLKQNPASFFIEYPVRCAKTLLYNYRPGTVQCFAPSLRPFLQATRRSKSIFNQLIQK